MIVMVFTVAINILLLAIPLYLFQISDRVLTSRSMDTLIMLTIVVVGAVLLQAFADSIRRFILMRTAVELEVQLGAPILSAAARASLHGNSKDYQTLQDLQQLRSFLTSGTLIAFLDAVRGGKVPAVTGDEGVASLEIAIKCLEAPAGSIAAPLRKGPRAVAS